MRECTPIINFNNEPENIHNKTNHVSNLKFGGGLKKKKSLCKEGYFIHFVKQIIWNKKKSPLTCEISKKFKENGE